MSPVTVEGSAMVNAGTTLIIEPGVIVQFAGRYALEVEGTLFAEGTEAEPITFTRSAATEESRWWGIRFINATTVESVISYSLIEHSNADTETYPPTIYDRGGGLYIYQSHVLRAFTVFDGDLFMIVDG